MLKRLWWWVTRQKTATKLVYNKKTRTIDKVRAPVSREDLPAKS